ncbi:MAG: glycoside hydrolase family 25 protein [bacterium]
MKKYITILPLIFLLFFLTFYIYNSKFEVIFDEEFNKQNIVYNNDIIINYYDNILLTDIISLNEGDISKIKLDTDFIGNKVIDFYYSIGNDVYKASANYTVVDTEAPLILNSPSYSVLNGNSINFLNTIFVADNYDTQIDCSIDGDYDFNVTGTYNLSIGCMDTSGNFIRNYFNLYVKDEIETYNYTSSDIYFDDLLDNYIDENSSAGIDVSHWQGDIDWDKVKAAGAEFVIIRIGYAPSDDGDFFLDKKFEENIKGAKEAGLDVGLYYFSYARSIEQVVEHANFIVDKLDGMELELPISFDWEIWSKFKEYELNLATLNQMALAFIETVEEAGYEGMNYSSAYYLRNIWDIDVPTWLAHYTTQTNYEGDYFMWQLADTGKIDGISGYVDLNILYKNK